MEKRIPRRRFKEFVGSGDWQEKKMGELIIIRRGLTYSPSDVQKEGVIVLRSSNIKQNRFVLNNDDVFVKEEAVNIDLIKENDILITSANGSSHLVGKHALVNNLKNKAVHGGFMLIASAKKPFFINALMSSAWYVIFVKRHIAGGNGAIGNLKKNDLENHKVFVPSLAEQEKIGDFFQKLDRLIDINREKLGKLKASKSAYLEEMFPREGEDRPRRRFQGFKGAWQEEKAKDICSISTGKSNTQDRNSDGKYPFYVRSPRIERSTKYLYNEEAVLTVGDGVGTGKVFHYVNGKYDLHQRVYRMFNFNNIMAKYFYYYFSVKFYDRVMSMTARTSVDSVRYEMISEMNILYPSMEEQIKIVRLLETLDQQIEVQEEKLEKLEKMKKAYLAEMFV